MLADFELHSLQKKLELKAGFRTGAERFSFLLNPDSDSSWWNYKKYSIQVGIKGIPNEKIELLAELLMEHETGHIMYTSRSLSFDSLPFPFSLLNIMEDARIEHKKGLDFSPLQKHLYEKFYKFYVNSEDSSVFSNPYNIGILLRWRLSGVETKIEKPEALTEEQFEQFVSDWENSINNSIKAASTEHVSFYANSLYEKWKWLFDRSRLERLDRGAGGKGEPVAAGSIEGSAEEMLGEGDSEDSSDDFAQSFSSTDVKDIACHFEYEWFKWDMEYIQNQANALRRLLEIKSKTEKEYKYYGRRLDIIRLHRNPPLPPFKTKTIPSRSVNFLKKLLIVIDGSASMSDEPFKNAAHLAYILSLVFPSDIKITTSCSSKPIHVPIRHIGLLRGYTAWGGGENYVSLGNDAIGYSFTLFLTDACVAAEDVEYVKNTLSKITKLGAGYVGDQNQYLDAVFHRNFYSESLNQDIARMVALFLRRYFVRRRIL